MAVAEEIPLDVSAVRMDVTLPCDARFHPMLEKIAAKAVAYFGYTGAEAAALCAAVASATTGVLTHPDGASYTSLALNYRTENDALTIQVRYLVETSTGGAAAGAGIERILNDGGDGVTPIDAMRQATARVEIGEVDGAECCTLVTPLPGQP